MQENSQYAPALAPALDVSQWLNTDGPISLTALRGKVVVLHAFQMLCPACVSHGIPQAIAIHHAFSRDDVVVLGLHTVFEHHAVMGPQALQVFMHEYRIPFPVGVDRAINGSAIPATMQAYGLRGTPSVLVLDRQGVLRLQHFGRLDDLRMGVLLGQLVAQPVAPLAVAADRGCTPAGCANPVFG
ncbi:MAG: redoxin domain-containing protein [Pseudomonadota bacterium]